METFLTIAITAGVAGLVGLALGIWGAGRLLAAHMVEEIINNGVLVYRGERSRVDRIGRKPSR